MPSISALSLTRNGKDWLANSQHPRILHVFDKACNLINEHKEVLSIVTPHIGNGPFNIVIDKDICFVDHLSLESHIFLSPNQLNLSNLIVHITNTKLWNPHPDWKHLHTQADKLSNQIKQLPIPNYQFTNSSFALARADIPAARNVASKLAGLGAGLTPAGDDFLMGAIYAAWILHPPEIAGALAQAIAETAAPLTTSLSAAWLRAAANGEAGSLWHEFLDALISGDPSRVQITTKNILAVGETSGADALAGFTSVFTSWMERTDSLHE